MRYIELIPVVLFCYMLIMDQKHFSKLGQTIKNLENSTLETKSNLSPNTQNIQAAKSNNDLRSVQQHNTPKNLIVKNSEESEDTSFKRIFTPSYLMW